jgi:hypothetical protein
VVLWRCLSRCCSGSPLLASHGPRTLSAWLQLLRAGWLLVVVLTHVAEALHIVSSMGRGEPHSIGHYTDLASALLSITLLLAAFVASHRAKRWAQLVGTPRELESIENEPREAGCSLVTLDTAAPLARAIRFYERNGYVRSGVVSDFFVMALYEYQKRP